MCLIIFEVFQRNANGKNDARCLALSGWDESRTLGAPIIATSASILNAEREHIGYVGALIWMQIGCKLTSTIKCVPRFGVLPQFHCSFQII